MKARYIKLTKDHEKPSGGTIPKGTHLKAIGKHIFEKDSYEEVSEEVAKRAIKKAAKLAHEKKVDAAEARREKNKRK